MPHKVELLFCGRDRAEYEYIVSRLFHHLTVTLYAAAVSARGQHVRQGFRKYSAFKIRGWITRDETDCPHYLFKTLNALLGRTYGFLWLKPEIQVSW